MTKISVIIPVYNCEKYLEQCIKSVLGQTLKELEVLCVDDGSTDTSAKIIRELQVEDTRIMLFQQKNSGAGVARNLGLQKAKGKYIAFLDADDYYIDNDALEIMFHTCENQNVNICGSSRMYMEGENSYVNEIFTKEAENKLLHYRDYQTDYFYQTYLFKRDFLEEYEIEFPKYRRFQDPPFFVKASYLAVKFTVADVCLYCYRMPDAAIRYTTEKVCDLLKGIIDNLLFARQYDLNILFQTTAGRLEHEFADIIYKNVSPTSLDILKLLIKANEIISAQFESPDVVIKPLRFILFPAELYERALVKKIETKDEIALYGAGKMTQAFLLFLEERNLLKKVKTIVVSDLAGNESEILGIPVVPLKEFLKEKHMFLLVTVGKKLVVEIADGLNANGYKNYEVIDEIFGDMLLY